MAVTNVAFGPVWKLVAVDVALLCGKQVWASGSMRAAKSVPSTAPLPQELRMQEDELVGVQWMPLEDYFAIPFTATR